MTVLATLPLDVLDRILTSLDSFSGLRAGALTCRNLYRVYEARPRSVLKAVAQNIVPGADTRAAALRAIRISNKLQYNDEVDTETLRRLLKEHSEARASNSELKWEECQELERRAGICAELEVHYSRANKDRTTATTSRLTYMESDAFQAATHRMWLMSSILVYSATHDFDICVDFSDRNTILYADWSTQHLWDLDTVCNWSANVGEVEFIPEHMGAYMFHAGPEGVLLLFHDTEPDDFDNGVHDDFIEEIGPFWEDDFLAIQQSRNMHATEDGAPPKGIRPLLASITGKEDVCKLCNVHSIKGLYNESNWQWMTSMNGIDRVTPSMLYNHLRFNSYEIECFSQYVADPLHDCTSLLVVANNNDHVPQVMMVHQPIPSPRALRLPSILQDLFALPRTITSPRLQARMLSDDFSSVTAADWLCLSCLRKLLFDRLWIWWWNEKARGRVIGAPLREDCWYGYECRTQTHSRYHAQKLNHLCPNTRT